MKSISYPLKTSSKHMPMAWGSEDWTISAYPGKESEILNGELAGLTISKVYENYPLLIKILKSRETLSVQVHPNDAQAKQLENEPRGKTEAWVVLRAEKGAKLIYGLDNTTSDEFQSAVRKGGIEKRLRWIEVSEGDVLYIPAGAVHALGAGLEVYEIQQSSDRTYRLSDWGRLFDGKPRELHIEKGITVTNAAFNESKRHAETVRHDGYDERIYIDEEAFTLIRFDIKATREKPARFENNGTIQALTMLGEGVIMWQGGEETFSYGESFLIPPELKEYSVAADCSALCGYVRR